ncbi:MAG: hypothetical protein EOO39_23900 [Cytophagaceae bacterium]|nr:MAG: hypothetical protein EOO39_23900 [Cytophagaceae bacterium]
MKKAITSTLFFVLLAVVAVGQVHRDTDDAPAGFSVDFTSLAIGLVIGATIGYMIGARAKKA